MGKIINNYGEYGKRKLSERKMSKKAILMTITALLLSTLFFVIFSKENILPSFYTNQPVNTRVIAMDNYVKTIPLLLGDSLEIATYNGLNSLYIKQSTSGAFFSDEIEFSNMLENCVTCGSENCVGPSSRCSSMNNTDLRSVVNQLRILANQHLNIQTNFSVHNIIVVQNYPYDVDVTLDIEYTATDPQFGITWHKRENISRIVSILDLYDPLIGINTNGLHEKKIIRSRICEFNESCWNLTSTTAFYNEKSFTYAVNGTSFLSRYWNSTESSQCCGIESFIYIADSRNVSFLDHYYFSGVHTCSNDTLLQYDGISSGFKLDSKTAGRYGISDYGVLICRPIS